MNEDLTWRAPDGTDWVYSPGLDLMTGWKPGEDGVWTMTPEEFRKAYPVTMDELVRWETEDVSAQIARGMRPPSVTTIRPTHE